MKNLLNRILSKLRGSDRESAMSHEWITDSVRYFREMNFFTEYAALSDADLAEQLELMHEYEWKERIHPGKPFSDLALLSRDKNRVWWKDTEADVCSENKVYIKTLEEWAAISCGIFTPENIREEWESGHGPVTIEFTHNSQEVVIKPKYLDDYIDIEILSPINRFLRHSEKKFALYEVFDQTAFVVMLAGKEQQKLQNERGWRFAGI